MTIEEFAERIADLTGDALESVLSTPERMDSLAASVAAMQVPQTTSQEPQKDINSFEEYLSGCSEFKKQ